MPALPAIRGLRPQTPVCIRVRGSGFGTPLRGGRRKPHADFIPKSPLDVWHSAPKKKWEPYGSHIRSMKTMRAHRRCCGTAVPARLPRLSIVQGTRLWRSDGALRAPHTPASKATRLVRAPFHVLALRKKYPLTCACPCNCRWPKNIAGRGHETKCRYSCRTNPETLRTPSGGAED